MANTDASNAGRTREVILQILKQAGPSDSAALATRLGVSAMAVRQHLYALQAKGLVTYEPEPRPVGRPAKLWRVTAESDRHFPDAHGDLAVGLLGAAREAFGAEGLERLVEARARQQTEAYRGRVPARGPLKRRVEALAAIRNDEGYMAEVLAGGGRGEYLLVENHCPISAAAHSCVGLCGAELRVFREVLGPGVSVERTEHIVSGARRCAYRIAPSVSAEN